jgi:TMEM175 potassium channel family protein
MRSDRLETFADGVLAIAATLLILNVDTQIGEETPHLAHRLLEIWPSYAGYAVSFLTIGIIWVNHHGLMTQIDHSDRIFLFLNVFLLMVVAFIPFPTRLVAEHIRDEGATAAAVAYGVTLTATAVMFNLVWFYASGGGGRLLRPDHDPKAVKGITRSYRPAPYIYLVMTLVAFVAPVGAVLLYGGFALFWMIESSLFGRSRTQA